MQHETNSTSLTLPAITNCSGCKITYLSLQLSQQMALIFKHTDMLLFVWWVTVEECHCYNTSWGLEKMHTLEPRKDAHIGAWFLLFLFCFGVCVFVCCCFLQKVISYSVRGNYFAPKILQIRYSAITIHQAVDTLIQSYIIIIRVVVKWEHASQKQTLFHSTCA